MTPGKKNQKSNGGVFANAPEGADHSMKCVKSKFQHHFCKLLKISKFNAQLKKFSSQN